MYSRTIFAAACCLLPLLIFSQSNTTVYFEDDQFDLTYSTKQVLDTVANNLNSSSLEEEIALIGHTDTDAPDSYNKDLAERRAKAVKAYLESKGVKNRLFIVSRGEYEPLNENQNDFEKALNRRVEIIRNYNSKNVVFEFFEEPFQQFNINPQKAIVLRCQKGTSIHIGPDIFETIDPNKNITIKVQEFYEKENFITANLTTKTKDGEILESRGMINIRAFQDGEPIDLRQGKSIDIGFRDREEDDGTTLFEGTETENGVVWEEAAPLTQEEQETSQAIAASATNTGAISMQAESNRIRQDWTFIKVKKQKILFWHRNVTGYWTVGLESSAYQGSIQKYAARESEVAMSNLLTSTRLGWINCDRFYKTRQPKVDFVVEYEGDFAPSVFIVFKKINSVMSCTSRDENKFVFSNVPVDMEIEIVGLYKNADNDEIKFARKPTKIRGGVDEKIEFLPVDAKTIEALMATL